MALATMDLGIQERSWISNRGTFKISRTEVLKIMNQMSPEIEN
jgi:hypothetical protein